MTENEKVQAEGTETTPVVEPVTPVEVSKVEDSSQAGDKVTEEVVTEPEVVKEAAPEDNKESQEDDEAKPDDDEEVWNMKQLRATKKEIVKVKHENKELKAENEALKNAPPTSSEADTKKIAELEAKIQEYTDKETESSKIEALKEAGLPNDLLKFLKGKEEEEWKADLEVLKNSYKPTNPTTRLKDDQITNSLNSRYKSVTPDDNDITEAYKKLGRRR